jgi:hypothetical protein
VWLESCMPRKSDPRPEKCFIKALPFFLQQIFIFEYKGECTLS